MEIFAIVKVVAYVVCLLLHTFASDKPGVPHVITGGLSLGFLTEIVDLLRLLL